MLKTETKREREETEDIYFSMLAAKREHGTTKWVSHEEAWTSQKEHGFLSSSK